MNFLKDLGRDMARNIVGAATGIGVTFAAMWIMTKITEKKNTNQQKQISEKEEVKEA